MASNRLSGVLVRLGVHDSEETLGSMRRGATALEVSATTRNRREVFRLLGGAALGGAAGMVGIDLANAKKRGGKNPQRCRSGRSLGTVSVPANGDIVKTPVLAKGQRYVLRASGSIRANSKQGIDAEYYFEFANEWTYGDTANGVDHGISIDGNQPDWDGGYDPNHVYEKTVWGKGKRLSLRLIDAASSYTNNSGSIQVRVTCG